MPDYEVIDHTADIGIRLSAPDLNGLFAAAAWAMFDLICDLGAVEAGHEIAVKLQAPDAESLLIAWLNELLFYHETDALLFKQFHVEVDGESSLSARAQGEPVDPARHTLQRQIKAATYHQLQVTRREGVWSALIIFDV